VLVLLEGEEMDSSIDPPRHLARDTVCFQRIYQSG
jgi:hypothetical protein